MNNKVCIECQIEKSITEFYTYANKKNPINYYQKCKLCHNKNLTKYEKKATGFNKLPIEVRELIIEALKIRQLKLKQIASDFQIHYGSLCYWSRKSLII